MRSDSCIETVGVCVCVCARACVHVCVCKTFVVLVSFLQHSLSSINCNSLLNTTVELT